MRDVLIYPDISLGIYAKSILSTLHPMNQNKGHLVRIGRNNDGGYIMVNDGIDNIIAYSCGISDDTSWDLDMASRGCHIYQYDHTIDNVAVKNNNFHFFRIRISGDALNDATDNASSIADIIRYNGHTENRDMILKMDIEGSEWNALYVTDSHLLSNFSQIVIEFHWLLRIDNCWRKKIIDVLKKINITHQSVHVHANNFGAIGLVGGVVLPETLEVTYLRREGNIFSVCTKCFPTALDTPNNELDPDYFLGPIGLITEYC
ncbi:hypothetical protein HF670_01775 [Acidithiobacillus thiooxidans]|uniref:FkbM family methyltransferase n=1 Tax=Acidithiobacillus thiooxidans TaxID=930 RepID=UPI001C06D047|nr:FkbM family methyltransferase [Acidithiobacillus thiooxidans]MBU2838317.1 hypothetical protein [Acidithiobacillus thiooxidans]